MVQCTCCGISLSNIQSMLDGMGPDCKAGVCKCGDKDWVNDVPSEPENLEKETQIIKTLYDKGCQFKTPMRKNSEKMVRNLTRKHGWYLVKDFSYHNFDTLVRYIENHYDNEWTVILTDMLSYKDKNKSQLVITLLNKPIQKLP